MFPRLVGVTPIAAAPDVSQYPPSWSLKLFPSFFFPPTSLSPLLSLPLFLSVMGFLKETKVASRSDADAQSGEKDAEQLASPSLSAQPAIDERKLMAKIDWHVVPALCVMYVFAFLDR